MSTATARAYQPYFAGRFAPFEMRKSPQNKAFYGHRDTYLGKAHCIKDRVLLDPACKTGVFLREIAKRLIKGLEPQIPDLQERIDHIFHKQLYAIAITELTSLLSRRSVYCSKYPQSEFSVTQFDDAEGNIRYRNIKHSWVNGKCKYCGISKNTVLGEDERGKTLEAHAYEWIHTLKPEEIFNMKFDVIIGNPPYQLSDGGAQASATPIYDLFVEQAKKLSPRYLSMIIPARWFGGGKGLDQFRSDMINDNHIRVLHDFLNASDCFGNGVEIKGGICYFLWDRDNASKCKVYTHNGKNVIEQEERFMKEENSDVFIRYAEGVSIYHKVKLLNESTIDSYVSSQKPFGLRTYVHGEKKPFKGSVKMYERGGIGFINPSEITRNHSWVQKPKVYISAAYNAGDTYPHQIIGKPIPGDINSCCTETYVVVGPFDSPETVANVISYIQTKLFRFLVMLKKTSQHAAASVYSFVPVQDFSHPWTDEELYKKYGITDDEIAFIDSMIKPMDLNGGDDDAD
jgi:site-specific DNA-methyltransferase (adenine-specific)